jgi:hypothetical protein
MSALTPTEILAAASDLHTNTLVNSGFHAEFHTTQATLNGNNRCRDCE